MRRRHATLLGLAALGVALAVTSCSTAPADTAPTPSAAPRTDAPTPAAPPTNAPPATDPVQIVGAPTAVVTGLVAPWSVVFLRGTALISERDSARILELAADGSTREVGTVAGVSHGGEGGLLGLAVDTSDRLYAYSTATDGNRIQRFTVTGAPGSFGLSAATTILGGIPAAQFHNGGRLAFGPDGLLYATIGDAGQPDNAQDLGSLGGKILRMTVDGAVPADNPLPGSLVYSYGHRNPQGLAWAADGTLFATEFGQHTWDELNVIRPGTNYGWPVVEGAAGAAGFTDPVQQWATSAASPSGMTRIAGTLFIANLRGAVLRAVPVADPSTSADAFGGEFGRIRDVVPSPDGALWFVTNNTDGRGNPGTDDDRIMRVAVE